MRYLMLGAGALGGYFGGMLIKGGADVTSLVRPKRAAQLHQDGLVVKLQDGSELRAKVKTVQQGELDGTYDVILLACKAYDLDGAMDAIAPAMSEQCDRARAEWRASHRRSDGKVRAISCSGRPHDH